MNSRVRMLFYGMMIVLLALISAFSVIPARADDGAPPPPAAPADNSAAAPASSDNAEAAPAPAPSAPADNAAVAPAPAAPTDAAPADAAPADTAPANPAPAADAAPMDAPTADAAPTDVAPAANAAPATDAAPADNAPTSVAPTDAAPAVDTAVDASQLPDGTNVVVLNASGDTVPLASQEAAAIVAGGDPIWCPSSVATPVNGGSGCSASFGSFKEVVDYLGANAKSVAGTIWISKLYNSSVDDLPGTVNFYLDGSLLPASTSTFALTIKGGWNGLGTNTVDITDPSVFNGDSLTIQNWNADVTISDIEITGVTTDVNALDVETTKNITLTRVNVHNNVVTGAYLSNTSGSQTGTTDKVSITSSQFNTNLGPYGGLNVYSWGSITVNSLTASSNSGGGANLDNCSYNSGTHRCDATTAQPVTLTGTNTFNDNDNIGLAINSLGNISTTSLTANHNTSGDGVWLENDYQNASGVNSIGTIAVTGNNTFNNNYYDGLDAFSNAAITTNSLTADNNGTSNTNGSDIYRGGVGAWLENDNIGAAAVTLTGTNEFNANYAAYWNNGTSVYDPSAGLVILSHGSITASTLTANNNAAGSGAILDNCEQTSGTCATATAQNVTLTGLNTFTGNNISGLEIYSKGVITTNNVTAANSVTGWGEYLENDFTGATGGITVSGTNSYTGNWEDGLSLFSHGSITVNSVTSTGNGLSHHPDSYGIYVENNGAGISPFTMTGTNNLSNNQGGGGLFVISKGAITINSLTASGNTHGYGAQLNNTFSTLATPQAVTLIGVNQFSSNYYDGLNVTTYGVVTLAGITANGNGTLASGTTYGYGVVVFNRGNLTVLPDVNATGTNQFNSNWLDGLRVLTYGNISLANVTAMSNGLVLANPGIGYGVYADNCNYSVACANLTPKTIMLSGTNNLSNNYNTGLFVNSKGAINVSSLTATSNTHGFGAQLNNTYLGITLPQAVTFSGVNQFSSNYYDGLNVSTYGVVTLASVTANGNGTLASGTTYGYGVYVNNRGNLTLLPDVNATGTNQFNNNWLNGLDFYTNGNITLASVTATGNGLIFANPGFGYGVYLNNCDMSGTGPCTNLTPKTVTLSGTNNLSNNYNTGLFVNSKGAINLAGVNASSNTRGFGAQLNNTYLGITLPQTVTITGLNQFSTNYYDGLNISTYGVVTLAGITANGNGTFASGTTYGYGVYVNNRGNLTLLPDVNATGVNQFNTNWLNGLDVFTNGNISLASVTALTNGLTLANTAYGYGIYLNNCDLLGTGPCTNLTPKTVTLSGTNNLSGNYNTGLFVKSKGAINLAGVTAGSNTHGFGALLNNTFLGITLPQAVTFSGVNQFNSNYYDGLNVFTYGVVTLASVTANGNGTLASGTTYGYGVYVDNRGNLTLLPDVNATGTNQFNNNWLDGLDIYTNGNITLASVTALSNGLTHADSDYGYGIYLDNCNFGTACANLTAKAVTLSGANNFSNNYNTGLYVSSKGAITVNNVNANNNGGYGALLENDYFGTAGVSVNNTATYSPSFNTNWLDGLDVYSRGTITLMDLDAENNGQKNFYAADHDLPIDDNAGFGVYLYNMLGTGSVTVGTTRAGWGNSLSNNFQSGLEIFSKGAVTLNNMWNDGNGGYTGAVTGFDPANGDKGFGAIVDNSVGAATPVTVTGNWNEFDGNFDVGLFVNSKGLITLKDIDAIGNNNEGANLDNTTGTLGVTLTGVNVFSENNGNGLDVFTNGAINASNLVVDSNNGSGVILDNCQAYLDTINYDCSTTTVMPVTLTGTNEFNFNQGGFWIVSNGAITTNNITASNNNPGPGAWILNDLSSAGSVVTMNGTNIFNDNGASGIFAKSKGIITLYNITADGNGRYGAELYNDFGSLPKAVNVYVSGSNRDNNFFNNSSGGLWVQSYGGITISGVDAQNNNNGDGAYLNNCMWDGVKCPGSGDVIINGWGGAFNNNGGYGLEVYSKGAITATSLNAWSNQFSGAWLNNTYGTGLVSLGTAALSGANFGNNGGDGLDLFSHGAITMNYAGANNNGQNNYANEKNSDPIDITFGDWGAGIYLDNTGAAIQPVNFTGNNNFYSNFDSGLYVFSRGTITVANLTVNDSHNSMGARLDNTASGNLLPQNVTLTGYGNFNNNYYTGLGVHTYGIVALTNLDAENNGENGLGGDGVYIDNCVASGSACSATSAKAITLNGNNNFQNNYNSGLDISSYGPITVNNLWSHDNGYGAWLDNTLGGPGNQQNVSITGFNDIVNNYNTGLTVYSYGTITLANLYADSNGQRGTSGDGVYLDNSENSDNTIAAFAAKTVTINGFGNVYNNFDYGLHIESLGLITIANLDASNQNGNGAFLNNDHTNASGGVTITVGAFAANNNGYGMQILSRGLISINATDTWSGNNSSYGWYFDNSDSPTKAGVTLTVAANNNIDFGGNGGFGFWVKSAGPITINNLGADNNGGAGVILDNTASGPATPQGVTVNGYGNFNNNGDDGLDVFSYGVITVTNLNANNNGQNNFYNVNQVPPLDVDPLNGWGVYLDNCNFVWDTVTPSNSGCASTGTPKGITLTGNNNFNHNFQDGLWATSYGPISATQINAQNNGGDGAYLDNQWARGVGGITVTSATNNSNNFSNNGHGYINGWTEGDGLTAYSNNGAITINNLQVDNNGAMGVWLDNTTLSGFPASPQGVTVNGYGNFTNNGDDGLYVFTYGAIAVTNIDAENNGQNGNAATGWGAYLDNCAFDWGTDECTSLATPKGITLTGTNNFNNNYQDGLWATSLGAISSTNLSANNNGGDGAYLDNQWSRGVGGISVTALTVADWNLFWGNGHGFSNGYTVGSGLSVFSNGAITLNTIWAKDNYNVGAVADNADHFGLYSAATPQTVTILGRNWFENNGQDGLDVTADGNISINNVLASRNQGVDGVWLDNCLFDGSVCAGHGGITLTGVNSFNNNYNGTGLETDSHGNILLNNVTANNNGNYGVWGGADGTIQVSCGSMNNNKSYGWWFQSLSTVTLRGVTAFGNNGGLGNTHLGNGTLSTFRSCP